MRKLFLLGMLFAATVCNAQVVLWDGTDKTVGSDGGFWGRANPTVVEEGGNKCLKITTKANPGGWDKEHCNAGLPLGDANLKGLRRLTMRVKMGIKHNVLVKLVKDGSYSTGRLFWCGTENEWNILTFEFAAGPDNDKIADTGNTVLEIWPFEDGDDALANIGKTIYIDDIKMEGPMVNGSAIRTLADNALTDQQVIVTGSLSKGEYQCTWDGDWYNVAFDDYATLTSKISANVCFLNLSGATVADGDGPQLRTKNPNLLILSPTAFSNTDNVITWDAGNSRNNTPKMVLTDAYPFYTPNEFHADAVEVTRNLKAGINSLCLPFYTAETEISTNCKIATYKNGTTFTYADHAEANVPFLATAVNAAAEKLNFTNKTVATTPGSLGTTFVGVYAPQSAETFYGINGDGKLQKGGSGANIKSFRAYLTAVSGAREITFEDETTGLTDVSSKTSDGRGECFNLAGQRVAQPTKGLYIVNGRKVVIK